MLSENSMNKITNIVNNNRQPKKRISKACIKCKNSKNKCINIEKGVCERCIELNEICIYDYSHNNTDDDSKVLISKEYLTLLQNKSMLTELILKTLFNDFDKLVSNDIININHTKQLDMTLSKQRDLWTLLINKNSQFCNSKEVNTNFNHMTTKYKSNLEINPLIQLILPNEIYTAMNAINFIGKNDFQDLFSPDVYKKVDTAATIVSNDPICKKRRRSSGKSNDEKKNQSESVPLMPRPVFSTSNTGLLGLNRMENTFKEYNKAINSYWGKEVFDKSKLPRYFNKSQTLVNNLLYNQTEETKSGKNYEENIPKRRKIGGINETVDEENCKLKMDLKMILND